MLRHTHASLCIDKGVDVELISKRLGHVNSNVTREIYIHKTKKQQENEQLTQLRDWLLPMLMNGQVII